MSGPAPELRLENEWTEWVQAHRLRKVFERHFRLAARPDGTQFPSLTCCGSALTLDTMLVRA
jgi:hypothetical protein